MAMDTRGEGRKSDMTPDLHDTDFAEWSDRTAALLRQGRFEEVDIENAAEEIESLGISQRHQLRSRTTQIIEHLLKLHLTSGPLREPNERGWRASISRQQGEISELLETSRSLRTRLTAVTMQEWYKSAARTVATEYAVVPPAECPFAWEQILGA